MTDSQEKTGVFPATCPCCGAKLWIDGKIKEVIKSEKAKKKRGNLDDLLVKEKKRQEEFDRRFDATFELQQQRHSDAEEKFKEALGKAEEDGGD